MDDFTGWLRKIEVEDIRLYCECHRSACDGSGIDFQVRVEYGRPANFALAPHSRPLKNRVPFSMR
jgi:hypothetical protein